MSTRSSSNDSARSKDAVRKLIRDGYSAIAKQGAWVPGQAPSSSTACCTPAPAGSSACCTPAPAAAGGCCGGSAVDPETLAKQIGYSKEELAGLPDGANLGLSCGNPAALAALRSGEIVLDLGAGAGFDVFLTGPRVGAKGRVIGVDMTADMIERARGSVPRYRERTRLDNVEFRLGEIEHLPVADRSVDVVISNCVLNLSVDKAQVWREIARVLRSGGRVAVSDLALFEPLPSAVLALAQAWVGCVAGAPLVAEHERWMREAGLVDLRLEPDPAYVETMTRVDETLYREIQALLPAGKKVGDFITSLKIHGRKP